ncbi:MAG TPA: NAD(P)-dependent oxidoreductase [Candidatus Paceibacterota bacterium]
MRILITGASGFVGSHLARALVARGEDVHIVLRNNSRTWRIDEILPRLSVHRADLTDREEVRRVAAEFKPEIIYHFANAGVYGGISSDFRELFTVNTIGLLNLLESFSGYRAFINVGSSSEYGLKEEPMRESDRCEPMNFYGVSKLAATLIASLEARLKNSPIATFRLFSPYGPFDDGRRLIARAILACVSREPFNLPHPRAVRDYIFIDDVVDFLAAAPEGVANKKGEVFNLGSGKENHAADVVSLIAKKMGAGDFVAKLRSSDELGPSESPRWQADMEKTFSAFASRPAHDLENGLARTIEWFMRNKDLYPNLS